MNNLYASGTSDKILNEYPSLKNLTWSREDENIMKEFHFWNVWHLGDHIFSCIYFYNIKQYIEKENIKIFYYIPDIYLYQVSEFIPSPNIILRSINEHTGMNIWIGCDEYEYNWFNYSNSNDGSGFDIFLLNFFNKLSEKINILVMFYLL